MNRDSQLRNRNGIPHPVSVIPGLQSVDGLITLHSRGHGWLERGYLWEDTNLPQQTISDHRCGQGNQPWLQHLRRRAPYKLSEVISESCGQTHYGNTPAGPQNGKPPVCHHREISAIPATRLFQLIPRLMILAHFTAIAMHCVAAVEILATLRDKPSLIRRTCARSAGCRVSFVLP
jgi:hypothetical protein